MRLAIIIKRRTRNALRSTSAEHAQLLGSVTSSRTTRNGESVNTVGGFTFITIVIVDYD